MNQPMNANHRPLKTSPVTATRTPPAMNSVPTAIPTLAATLVAFCWLPVTFQTRARSTLPPSIGNPGTMLKTPRTILIVPR